MFYGRGRGEGCVLDEGMLLAKGCRMPECHEWANTSLLFVRDNNDNNSSFIKLMFCLLAFHRIQVLR